MKIQKLKTNELKRLYETQEITELPVIGGRLFRCRVVQYKELERTAIVETVNGERYLTPTTKRRAEKVKTTRSWSSRKDRKSKPRAGRPIRMIDPEGNETLFLSRKEVCQHFGYKNLSINNLKKTKKLRGYQFVEDTNE